MKNIKDRHKKKVCRKDFGSYYVLLMALWACATLLPAQSLDTLLTVTLDPVVVEATRLPTEALRVPYAISRLDQHDWGGGRQQLSLAAPLSNLPGLLVLNPNNFAQDLRLSVRGFGARSAFGIRGVKILVDGLPETTPDGQGQVDNLDAGLIAGAALLSGPASGMYGNAAGGVVRLETEDPPEQPFIEVRLSGGSYEFQRYQLKSGGQTGAYRWIAYGSHTRQEGFREQSRMENTLLNAKIQRQFGVSGQLEVLLNYVNSPIAEDPGGLSRELFEKDPSQAWSSNRTFVAGEAVEQGRVGLRWSREWVDGKAIEVYGFYLFRDFNNRLPFEAGGAVQLFRNYAGGGIRLRGGQVLAGRHYRSVLGVDVERQTDRRKRHDNLEGAIGPLVFDQLEVFSMVGLYWVQEWSPLQDIWLTVALRYDFNHLVADDRLVSNGDASGTSRYQNLSPSLGGSYAVLKNHHLYGNYSYSFETPALSELSVNPDGAAGFNKQLQPQRAHNYELGAKGQLASWLNYQTAVFYLQLNNELVPYELSNSPGRFFYRNAGASTRKGVEAALRWQARPRLFGRLSYTFSDFSYTDYEVDGVQFGGQQLPGIPKHLVAGQVAFVYSKTGRATLEGRYLSRLYADDANTAFAEAFLELNLLFSQKFPWKALELTLFSQKFPWKALELTTFGGVNNLLNATYVNNVRLNAFGGRYFEAISGIHVYAGIQVRLSIDK
jgi:iron complex outermembrane receptor protein